MRARKTVILLTIFMCGAAIFWGILYPDKANSGPYLNSAHGNTAYGVDRTSLSSFGYSKGNCAHCHEQHAKIGGSEPAPVSGVSNYLLLRENFNTGKYEHQYIQRDDVCFSCHIGTGSYQQQPPVLSNYSYSYTFGGCSATDYCPAANIMDSFNSLSYHNLYDVWRFITGQSGTKIFANFPFASNPCSGCHNVHIAQKSCGKPSDSFDDTKAAISKPSEHGNLWGDSDDEKMSKYYAGSYQAPYYKSAITYEPDGSSTSDPSKLPDYVAFCTDCHNATNTINSRVLGRSLHTINWANEMHGGYAAGYCSLDGISLLAPPYDGVGRCGQYVLACTDCHEPHGSPNNFLIRKWVNNGFNDCRADICAVGTGPLPVTVTDYGAGNGPDINPTTPSRPNKEWVWLCGKCHTRLTFDTLTTHHTVAIQSKLGCTICHAGTENGSAYTPCSDCHFHGNRNVPGYGDWGKPLF